MGSNTPMIWETLANAQKLIRVIQRFPALVTSIQQLPKLMPALLRAVEGAREAASLLSSADHASTTLQNCQKLDYSSCHLDGVWTNIGEHAPVIPYDG